MDCRICQSLYRQIKAMKCKTNQIGYFPQQTKIITFQLDNEKKKNRCNKHIHRPQRIYIRFRMFCFWYMAPGIKSTAGHITNIHLIIPRYKTTINALKKHIINQRERENKNATNRRKEMSITMIVPDWFGFFLSVFKLCM